ncbi:Hypothetical_protein [Hexamita inflata]|uniref:Hypothetical_protein n=1 Tax=Hexamita inflata TaxID=28002 RepID=A0AA86UII7_9EUKA|nr:Hypothetical protein HINF_LOCUS40486 [Hexamita inflata]
MFKICTLSPYSIRFKQSFSLSAFVIKYIKQNYIVQVPHFGPRKNATYLCSSTNNSKTTSRCTSHILRPEKRARSRASTTMSPTKTGRYAPASRTRASRSKIQQALPRAVRSHLTLWNNRPSQLPRRHKDQRKTQISSISTLTRTRIEMTHQTGQERGESGKTAFRYIE